MKRSLRCSLLLAVVVLLSSTALAQGGRAGRVPQDLVALSESFKAIAERVTPAVVQVFATGYAFDPGIVSSTGELVERRRGTGSGVILDPNGYIVTNAHVVAGARRVRVLLPASPDVAAQRASILKPMGEQVGAQIVGIDDETDLAVLKIARRDLPYLTLADSEKLTQGELVLAFGSPLGLENSVSMGVVSAVARQLQPEAPMVYIQTDASINPGNSGGPLVNARGEVVGINTLIFTQSGGSEGIGFAAPSHIVKTIFEQIKTTGRVHRSEIGVATQTIDPLLATGLKLPKSWGVLVSDVLPGSPGMRAGVRVGDIIESMNGKMMENSRQFRVNVYRQAPGSQVQLELLRDGVRRMVQVDIIERPDNPARFQTLVTPDRNLIEKLGILCLEIDERIRLMLPSARLPGGIVVASRAADSPATGGGFFPGDIIYAVNNEPVPTLDALRRKLDGFSLGDAVVVQVERRGRLQFITSEIEQ